MNLLTLSWKNILNKPLSSFLSLLLFALGVGMISLLLMLQDQMQEKFDRNLAGIDLVIGAKGSPLQLILCNMYHVDVPTGNISIEEAKPFMRPGHPLLDRVIPLSLGDNYKGYRLVGTLPSILDLYESNIETGGLWQKPFDVVIGAAVAEELGLSLGDRFKSSHGLVMDEDLTHEDSEAFVVTGILAPSNSVLDQLILTDSESIWHVHDHGMPMMEEEEQDHDHGHDHDTLAANWGTMEYLLDHPEQEITSLLVTFKTRNFRTLNLQRTINENTDLMAASPAFEINRMYSMLGVGLDLLRTIALIIVVVSALSIFVSLFNSLKDRRYELALIRVMGANRRKLFFLIVFEGLILAVLGYLFGIIFSHIGMEVLANYMEDAYRYAFTGKVFMTEEIYLLGGALLIGFIAALIPAWQAFGTDISETLSK